MNKLEMLLDEYSRSHTHPINIAIHKICVPLIMLTIFGMLWCIPLVKNYHFLNCASAGFIFCSAYYFTLGKKVFFLMCFQILIMLTGIYYFNKTGLLLKTSIGIFVVAWIFQFVGHLIEGKKPSFFKDAQSFLIGPIWSFSKILGKF